MYNPQHRYKQSYTQPINTLYNTQCNKNNLYNTQTNKNPSQSQIETISQLKDTIISMQYRIKTIQQQINVKMQRQQCLTLMQRKSNTNYVKKCIDQIYHKIQIQKEIQSKERIKLSQQQKNKINQMKKKLKNINNNPINTNNKQIPQFNTLTSPTQQKQSNLLFNPSNQLQKITSKINKILIQPQQLYLQSNQTMFSMLIDQIKQLKSRDSIIERLIENKHKKTVSLNNQVCRKLQYLQNSIEQTIKYIDQLNKDNKNDNKQKKNKKNSINNIKTYNNNNGYDLFPIQKQKQKVYSTLSNPNQAFESIRIQLLSKSVQSLQRELLTKINIKDIIPLIKQNLIPHDESINQIRQYVEENFQSTRKILSNQSQINQQISNANKFAWWHLYEREDNYLVFNRQIINIIPETLIIVDNKGHQNNITLKIMNQGWYFIQIYSIQQDTQQSSNNSQSLQVQRQFISNNKHNRQKSLNQISQIEMQVSSSTRYTINKEKLINFSAGTQIKFIANVQELFLKIQKL